MTIVTKPLTGEKKPDVQPLVTDDGSDVEKGAKGSDANATAGLNERYHYILRTRAARVSSATTLCLLITALLVMTSGLFGGLYVYRQMTRSRFQKLWCNVPLDTPFASSRIYKTDDDVASPIFNIQQNGLRKIDDDGLTYLVGDDPQSDAYFQEKFELDVDNEAFSKIDVPDFKNGRMGRFIHEFDSNKTAIVDQTMKRCFIMPLDRDKISPPKTMFDMIQKMQAGYYSVNTHRVRQSMRVILPPLDDLSDLGEYIQDECKDKVTYRLEKSTSRVIKKRSVEEEKPYAEFAGIGGTIEYYIENLNKL